MSAAGHISRAGAVRRVLWIVLGLNVAVVLIKLAVGLASGALAIVADAFHSVVDSSSNLVGLAGLCLAARPADDNHPYGHQKYESMATLAIGGLLLAAAYEISKGVLERLRGAGAPPDVTAWTVGLMALTFVINLGVTLYEQRAGRQLRSDLLLADAAHTRTDLFVTLAVIGSLLGVRFGLPWLDPLVAAAVVILLVRAAFQILFQTSRVLTDAAVADPEAVRRLALSVPGVRAVGGVRSRGLSEAAYVDLHIRVHPAMDAAQAHGVASEVEHRITQSIPGVLETLVYVEPGGTTGPLSAFESVALRLRSLADGMGISFHDLHVHVEQDGSYTVELHLEVDAGLSLGEAHQLADEFERRVRASLPIIRWVISHIEPLPTVLPDEDGEERNAELCRQIGLIGDQVAGAGASHDVVLHRLDGHLIATLDITRPADQPLVEAHALAESIESQLLARYPRLRRVVVHVEPPELPA